MKPMGRTNTLGRAHQATADGRLAQHCSRSTGSSSYHSFFFLATSLRNERARVELLPMVGVTD